MCEQWVTVSPVMAQWVVPKQVPISHLPSPLSNTTRSIHLALLRRAPHTVGCAGVRVASGWGGRVQQRECPLCRRQETLPFQTERAKLHLCSEQQPGYQCCPVHHR